MRAAGAGPLVMFVHGFPEFWYEWRRQLVDFGRDHLAVAPDMRGYNLSVQADRSWPTTAVAEARRGHPALATHLGHSALHPGGARLGRRRGLGVRDGPPRDARTPGADQRAASAVFARELRENPAQQKASQYMLLFRSPEAEAVLSADTHQALRVALGDVWDKRFTDEDRRMYLEAWSRPGGLTGGLNWYRAARVGPPTADAPARSLVDPAALPVIEVPTLVIWGEQDRALTTGNLDGLDKYVRHLTITRVPDGTHWVVHEQPELITREVRAFMRKS